MMDLKPYTAKGFTGNFDKSIANVGVAGIDREQAHAMIRLCPETEACLYGPEFSPRRVRYRAGSRPELDRVTATMKHLPPRERAVAAMKWVITNVVHPHLIGKTPPDRGMTEEQLIASGRGWCNEQTRVFIGLCQVMGLPARVAYVFHCNGVCGHTAAEVLLDGKWSFFDVTFDVTVSLPDGTLASAAELSGPKRQLAHDADREPKKRYQRATQTWVHDEPGWGRKDRPSVDQAGDLLDGIGICNYVIEGVDAV